MALEIKAGHTVLRMLRVRNLAVVDDAMVEWQPGLNTVTGETGAGKSVIVGALNLLLGERADRSLIRSGADSCNVEAVFEPPELQPINSLLEDAGLPACEDGQLVIRRSINAAGSGKNLLNDSPVTLQMLKNIGDRLVDMHGPHEHQSLFSRVFQMECLDSFGKHTSALNDYTVAYRNWQELLAQRAELDGDGGGIEHEMALLSDQVAEFEQAAISGADHDIEKEHAIAANAQRVIELADGICRALDGEDGSAFTGLVSARKMLHELANLTDEAKEWESEVAATTEQVRALAQAVESMAQSIDLDPEHLHKVEERMSLIYRLKRKYGGSLEAVMEARERITARLNLLQHRNEEIERLDKDIATAEKTVLTAGKTLDIARHKASKQMVKDVTAQLRDLGFSHGAFGIELTECAPGPAGISAIEFGFAPNAGEPMRPLRAIASSGEISRVMLALKTILAEHDSIPVLVFDEIDANVGGEMGTAIGRKLQTIAKCRQVLCITHLPQVAVSGQTHYVVQKSVDKGRTFTRITPITDDERVNEIARMLTGSNPTATTLKHAREMLGNSR